MKTVVSLQDLLELEIHPEELSARYRELLARDVGQWWRTARREASCPGCGGAGAAEAFAQFGAQYRECVDCRSLFVSPRPDEAELIDFYRRSPSAIFWRERVWPATSAARREKIVRPRVDWVLDGLAEYAPDAARGLDLSPYGGPFIEELSAGGCRDLTAGFPLADLDLGLAPPGTSVRPLALEAIPSAGPVDFVTAFDAVSRSSDVHALIDGVAAALRPGGLLFMTMPNADGFDVQVLWNRHPALTPPDKLNLLSIAGLERRLGRPAWELLEVSTPGMFDVEQVRRVVEADPDGEWPRFVRTLVSARDAKARGDFQECLQRNRLASFARVVARRR
ncbi:MAG: hypothetical protein IT176_14640 [Acidobacteria bacterium]|nr:hypothetical protein [Acidobacteriota bacterium]